MTGSTLQPASDRTAESVKTRILVVDDHPLVCEGMSELINRQPDLLCCACAYNPEDAQAAIIMQKPDLMLLDIRLGNSDGLELIKVSKVHLPAMRILVLSQLDETIHAERALRAGALGYVMKEQATEELLRAIRTVLSGDVYVSQKVSTLALRRLAEVEPRASASQLRTLTARELLVFKALGQGKSTREIASNLNLSIKTIETHREHLKYKLSLANAAELVHYAHQWLDDLTALEISALTDARLPSSSAPGSLPRPRI